MMPKGIGELEINNRYLRKRPDLTLFGLGVIHDFN